jgi:hypothetical protein
MTTTSLTLAPMELGWKLPTRGTCRNVRFDRGRGCDFHHLRRGLPLLYWQEPLGTHAERGSLATFLLHRLPALEQCNDSLRNQSSSRRRRPNVWCVVVCDDSTRRNLSLRNRVGMAPPDL